MAVPWFLTPKSRSRHRLKLVCLPYAGGAAAAYREWSDLLPDDVEVHAVQLPGRGWRLREEPLRDLRLMAEQVAGVVAALDGPIALFGHSMGSWLGLEVARRLQELSRLPRVLVVSGRQAPALGPKLPPMSHLDDAAFVETLQVRYGGIPAPILDDADLLRLLLPAIRADVEAMEVYSYGEWTPLSCPIVAVGGDSDPLVTATDLEAWRNETSEAFRTRMFRGGHFYLTDTATGFFEFLANVLSPAAASSNPGVR